LNAKSAALRARLLADGMGRMGRFHSELRRKYSQAVWTPWRLPDSDRPVGQDPAW
jgi:hypothetical protein